VNDYVTLLFFNKAVGLAWHKAVQEIKDDVRGGSRANLVVVPIDDRAMWTNWSSHQDVVMIG